jgi:hypothetical protein
MSVVTVLYRFVSPFDAVSSAAVCAALAFVVASVAAAV